MSKHIDPKLLGNLPTLIITTRALMGMLSKQDERDVTFLLVMDMMEKLVNEVHLLQAELVDAHSALSAQGRDPQDTAPQTDDGSPQ